MSDKPVFLYAAIYDDIADAEADYEAVFDLHAAGAIGTFDSAVIRKEDDGKVRVTKTEKPTQHGAWTGAGVGALVGLVFPPAIIGSAIVGAGAGGLVGHLRKGISRGDLKDLGDELEAGTAAVIVIGESKIEEQLEKAMTRANKLIEKQVDADADELKREIDAAARADGRGQTVIPLLLAFRGLARALAAVWRDPETKALPSSPRALVLTGSLFYWRFEDWTFLEALYFSIVTLTTVGYGDFSPTTAGTQIFTIFYILTGFGVLVALLTSVAQQYMRQKAEAGPARARLKARRQRDSSPELDES